MTTIPEPKPSEDPKPRPNIQLEIDELLRETQRDAIIILRQALAQAAGIAEKLRCAKELRGWIHEMKIAPKSPGPAAKPKPDGTWERYQERCRALPRVVEDADVADHPCS